MIITISQNLYSNYWYQIVQPTLVLESYCGSITSWNLFTCISYVPAWDFSDGIRSVSQKWQRRFFVLYEHGCLRFALDESVSCHISFIVQIFTATLPWNWCCSRKLPRDCGQGIQTKGTLPLRILSTILTLLACEIFVSCRSAVTNISVLLVCVLLGERFSQTSFSP